MTKSQQQKLDRLRRVAGFGYRHEKDFQPKSRAHTFFAQSVDLLTEIELLREKIVGGMNSQEEKRQAYLTLHEDLERIALTARLVERHNWLAAGKFPQPNGRSREGLVEIARQFLTDAEPIKDEFLDYELPADFLEQLKEHIQTYEALNPTPTQAAEAKNQAQTALIAALEQSLELVELLDVIISNKYQGQTKVLAEWKQVTGSPK